MQFNVILIIFYCLLIGDGCFIVFFIGFVAHGLLFERCFQFFIALIPRKGCVFVGHGLLFSAMLANFACIQFGFVVDSYMSLRVSRPAWKRCVFVGHGLLFLAMLASFVCILLGLRKVSLGLAYGCYIVGHGLLFWAMLVNFTCILFGFGVDLFFHL